MMNNIKQISIRSGIEDLGIFEKNSDAWVSSRDVAKLFEKEHKRVMQDIREKIEPFVSEEFNRHNIVPVKNRDKKGEMRPEYLLNRKSFSMVVMGYTGKKAMHFKEAYIEAFEAMRTVIDTRMLSKAGYKEMTAAISAKYKSQKAFAIEADMINRIILGMKASDFRSLHQIDNKQTRDSVVFDKLEKLDKAQRLNAQLIHANIDYDTRKAIIMSNFTEKSAA